MKQTFVVLTLALALLAIPVLAQHQHQQQQQHHPPGQHMMGEHKMPAMMAELTSSWEKVGAAQTEQERKAAMEEHGRLLTQLQQRFEQHHKMMQEHMQACPMMQQKMKEGQHQKH